MFSAWPVEYIIYTAAFPSALTGADLAIFAGCFAYIADVSSLKNRTLRVGILDVVYLSTMPSGVALGKFEIQLLLKEVLVYCCLRTIPKYIYFMQCPVFSSHCWA